MIFPVPPAVGTVIFSAYLYARFGDALAWIHGPGMILTPILGGIAFEQKSDGQRIHGIASAHGPVAIVTTAAYIAAILSVSFKFFDHV